MTARHRKFHPTKLQAPRPNITHAPRHRAWELQLVAGKRSDGSSEGWSHLGRRLPTRGSLQLVVVVTGRLREVLDAEPVRVHPIVLVSVRVEELSQVAPLPTRQTPVRVAFVGVRLVAGREEVGIAPRAWIRVRVRARVKVRVSRKRRGRGCATCPAGRSASGHLAHARCERAAGGASGSSSPGSHLSFAREEEVVTGRGGGHSWERSRSWVFVSRLSREL